MKKIDVKRSWSRWSQSDRTLVSEEPVRLVSCNSEDAGIGQMTGRWKAVSSHANVAAQKSHSVTGRWLCPVKHDRTRPVVKYRF